MKTYVISPKMEYIPLDENEQVIHDTESGDIHYIDEISTIILGHLAEPMSADELIAKLIDTFEGDPDVIRADTLEFLDELEEKKVLLTTDVNDDEN